MVNATIPGMELTPEKYTTILICMKLCREGAKHKQDNLLDMINYASFLDEIHENSVENKGS